MAFNAGGGNQVASTLNSPMIAKYIRVNGAVPTDSADLLSVIWIPPKCGWH